MLAKRIIPCLDVKEGRVVKGVQFRGHRDAGDIVTLACAYNEAGADELVFYDITASIEGRVVDTQWIEQIARWLNIPFCVAGGVRSVADARKVLNAGADKVSINTPALRRPDLITELAEVFGRQCVVVGIDSMATEQGYVVYQYTGDPSQSHAAGFQTVQWLREVQRLGAGEIVLNCMNRDGVKQGYDIEQLRAVRAITHVPLIASGGAGTLQHFSEAFETAGVDGALAASVFHDNILTIQQVKAYLADQQIEVRL